MKIITLLTVFFTFTISLLFAQTTVTYNYTGGVQNFVVPPCVTSINVTVAGADGGGTTGGNGAVVTGTLAVTPGQTLQITVGGSGNCPGGGYGGGGNGQNANSAANGACGGGGASSIAVSPFGLANRVVVAGGGGGMGGGTEDAIGGAGGCGTGQAGTSPFGQGGGGATQTAGGTAGPPWIASGNPGTAGSLGQGGTGGTDPCYNNSPGGGGGGGYYGGGGGGSDCYSLAPYGGGSGGGGSSLVPAGGGCTQGSNNGPGYVTITYTTATVVPTFTQLGPYCQCATPGVLPITSLNGITGTWSPATISTATAGTTTYTFTPNAGQCGTPTTMNITVNPVSVTMPANGGATVACPSNTNTAPTPPTVLDNCGRTLTVSAPVISAIPTCAGTRTYTYTYTNACGTTYPWTYTYTVSPPVVVMPANGSSTVACPANTNTAPTTPTVTDNCGRTLTVSAPVVSAIPTCAGTRTYTYTYTACNGATFPWTYTYTVSPPVVVMPANGSSTVACPTNTNTAPTPPTVLDNCGRTLTVSAPVVSAIPTCAGTRTYTYTYTACNGATFPWTYTYTVSPPVVVMPANGSSTVACPSNTNTAPTPPTVLDNCGRTLTVSAPVVSAIPTCAGTRTYTYTYTACDGATFPWTYTYTVSPPVVVMPANGSSTVACPTETNTAPTPPTIVDNCGRTLTVSAPVVSAIPTCAGTRTYTYTYTACNGTTYPWVFTYTVSPPAPVIMPANGSSTVPCASAATAPTAPTVTDNCGRTLTVSAPVVSPDPACAGTKTYTYTYTDCAGTTYPWVYTYTISAPIVTMPANGSSTVACPSAATAPTAPTVTDNCGRTLTVSAPVVSPDPACAGTKTYTYTYTDCAGTTYPWVYTYTISAPTVTMPANGSSTVACPSAATAPTAPTITDNCGRTLTVSAPVVSPDPACAGTKTYTYTYTDCAGTTYPWVYTYTISAPTVIMPANEATTVTCTDQFVNPTTPNVVDNCGRTLTVSAPIISADPPCGGTKTYTYTYTDCAGVNYSWVYTYTFNDNISPTASNPADISVPGGSAPAPDPTVVTDEADNCGTPTVAWVSDMTDGGFCPETITRTYSVTDACGNQILVTQLITIGDPINPTASNPGPITVECIGDVPAPDPAVVNDAADNSGIPVVTWESDVSDNNTCPETITRTYRVTDPCANFIFVTQTITVQDITAPVFAAAPATITVACAADVPAMINLGYTDNCDPAGSVTGTDVSDGNSCPETITRTWTYTDACGNTSSTSQTIIVHDLVAPLFAAAPAAVTVTCAADVPAMTNLGYTDNCEPAGSVTGTDVSDGNTCPETITRTWTFTDACGNTATTSQTITVHDLVAPVFAPAPAAVTVECSADVPAMTDLGYTDNCDPAGSVTGTDGPLVGGACGGTITRTWTITDACGNTTTTTQLITIDDTTPPTASNPATTTVPGGPAPAIDPAVVIDEADNCTLAPVVAFVSESSDGQACPETITRIYSVTDDCGNSINVTHTILITDPIDPTASNPAPITVECIGDVPAPDPSVVIDEADNNGVPVVTWESDVSDNNTCPETITRTYRVTDPCSNFILVTQTITVQDITAPVFAAAPATITVACAADVPAMINLGYTDNCDPAGSMTGTDVSDGNSCPETITRTWTYTDACGNTSSTSQTIIVHDLVAPLFAAAPAAVTVACAADVPAMTNLGYTDNCDPAGSVTGTDVSDGNTCPETITRTWTFTDACGNTATTSQTITVHDLVAPVFAPAPAAVTVECSANVPAMTDLGYTDNCDPAGSVTGTDGPLVGGACGGTITRTWTITDACGNTTTTTQLITIDDTTPPTASNPATTTVPGGPAPAVDPAVVIDEADNCTLAPVVAFVSESSDGQACPETITRIYSVTDDCGNSINVTHTILITDPIDPTASNPAPITVECIGDVPAQDPSVVIDEADNNGVPIVTWESDVSDNNTCPETITRTYRVTDLCGNFIFVEQQIVVNDITAPIGTAPATVTVQCNADVPAPNISLVTGVSDNCTAIPTVAHVSDVSDNNTCPETITRTYSITDDCGNSTTVAQTIIVDDTTPPVGVAPATVTVECSADVPVANTTSVTGVSDNCTAAPLVEHLGDVSDNNTCPETITRTYAITDDCGNVTTVEQTIIVDDTTPPTASNPATTTVPGGPAPAIDPTVVIDEADNCTVTPVVAFVSESSDGQPCPETITRIYSVTDDCGNSINVTHTILITDPIDPTASNPAPITVECIGDVPSPDPAVVIDEADNNGIPIVTWESDESDNNTCPETITRTYRVTDVCDNFIFVTQTIIVNDITAPLGTAPATVTVQCNADVPAPNIALVTGVSDNCTVAPTVAHVNDVSDNNTCPETITRTYSITDDCGNSTTVVQTIIVDDTTLPTASNPSAITIECITETPAPDPTVVTDEADNCTLNPLVAWVNDVSDGNTCPETITRTYSVTDDCGNQIFVTQSIIINDLTAPTASNPLPVVVELQSQVPAPDPTVVTDEADNCTVIPTVTWVSDVSDNGSCPETITRTYLVTDDCGNSISVQQTITISDITLPTASNPATITVECIGDVPSPNIAVVTDPADNSGSTLVTWLNDVSDGNSCPETITRTYAVADDCANTITVQQTIVINDITPPTATAPAPVTVECIEDVPPVPLSAALLITDASDNCTNVPTVDWVNDVSDGNTCPEVITRTYRVLDDCGNQTLLTQEITILDTTLPTASNPTAISVECIFDVPAPNPAVVIDEADNCTASPLVTWVSDVSNGNTCPEVITRTYAITDDCGNSITVNQTITVNDITNPTASNPAPISVVSAASVPAPDPSVVIDEADNCTAVPTVTWINDVSDGNVCNNEQITRTYSVTDDCGNSITVTQLITITAVYPTLNAGPDQILCEGESTSVNATYSPASTVISWNNGIFNNTPFYPSVGNTTYTVTGNNYECISTDQMSILVHPLPVVGLMPDENMGCQPLEVEFTNLSSSAAGLVSCTWNLGDGTIINGCNDFDHTYQGAGFFDVTLTTTDGNGCTNSVTFDNLIYVEPYPVAAFTPSQYELNNLLTSTEVDFTNNSVGASTYLWSFGDDSYSTQVNPSHNYETTSADNFTVMLIAYSGLGCPDTTYQNFTITEELIYYVPNTFTPDGNAFNNTFQPVFTSGFDPYHFNLYIFNRWGELIFESHDASIGWDGTYNGELMQDGTYTWKIDFKSRVNDEKYQAVGHVNLLR